MQNLNTPLVSIGVPVYNGEKLIARALNALLEQDYKNIEIIISDNGSTDKTAKICRDFLSKDRRVKYYRSDQNNGSSWNFNRVVELSGGKYFMWAAHDDLREPSFVRSCVEKMEKCPTASLCQAHTAMFVEGNDEKLCIANLNSFEGVMSLSERYHHTLKYFPATAIYGLYRLSLIKRTRLFEKVIATDLAFIQELSIHGPFVQVPELLFYYIGREKWNTVDQDYKVFFGNDIKPWWYIPFVILFLNHFSRIASTKLPLGKKLLLWSVLIKYEITQLLLKIFIKVCGKVCPKKWRVVLASEIYRRWLKGPNLEVYYSELFLERIIKPKVGWWR